MRSPHTLSWYWIASSGRVVFIDTTEPLLGLVVSKKVGREKLHFLNPVPIRLIHDRWIDKYTERRVTALLDLKNQLEQES